MKLRDQMNQIQRMMEELIRITANTNAAVEELRQDNKELNQRMDNLETRFDNLETRFDNLETRFDNLESQVQNGFDGLTSMVNLLGEKTEAIPRIETKLDVLNDRTFEHEADIRMLRKQAK
ncbi:hypothetical protein SCACP_08710 [Sporomusa carbonis]|uniref:hypothetical protein n=1 Tax=Sporomusa carbonis TaxID=3076075 RepID=UPI003A6596C8